MTMCPRSHARHVHPIPLALAAAVSLASCGDSTGSGGDCPGAETARLHVVNTTDTPGFTVTATYSAGTCGPIDLPISDAGGLELAQFVIEAGIGDQFQVRADGSGAATTTCEVSSTAIQSGGTTCNYQLFVNFVGAPTVSLTCGEGLIQQ